MRFSEGLVAAATMLLVGGLSVSPTLSGSSESYPFAEKVGEHGFINALDGWWICRSREDLKKWNELMFDQNDYAAAMKVFERDCTHVNDGTEVVVEKRNAWFSFSASDKICVRPLGEPECGWVEPGAVTKVHCTRENWRQHQGCVPRQ